jgi:peptide/nickel transport system ATP-binding protein
MQPGVERDAPLLQGDLPNPASPPSGCRFHTRCPYVTDECRQVEPINQVLDGGRQVACHRWQEINRDRSVIQIAPPSAAFCAAARCLNTRPLTRPFLQGTHDNDNA